MAPPALGLEPIPFRDPGRIFDHPDAPKVEPERWTFLHGVDAPLGVVVRRGEGLVVVLASASPFQNRDIESSDGGVLFARLLAAFGEDRAVLFDEYHLGVGERQSMTQYFRKLGATSLMLQLLLVLVFFLWRSSTRVGRPRTSEPPTPGGTADYVQATGHLYSKARDPAGAVVRVARHAVGLIARHHRLEPGTAAATARRLEERGRAKEAAAVRFIARIEGGAAEVGDRQLVVAMQQIDDLRREATQYRSREATQYRSREATQYRSREAAATGKDA
ncbi:MAG: hypothetical protein AAGF12_26700 [Myxococcota bacterium]